MRFASSCATLHGIAIMPQTAPPVPSDVLTLSDDLISWVPMRRLVAYRCAGGRASVTTRTEYVGCKATFCCGCDVRASRGVPAADALPLLNTASSHDDDVVAYVGSSMLVLSHTVLRIGLI